MNIDNYPEINPQIKHVKKIYVAVMLWIVGRAIAAAARVDRVVQEEFSNLRDDFMLRLWVAPGNLNMFVGKDKNGKVKYMGWNPQGKTATVEMQIKGLEQALLLFTFQESTAVATCNDRIIVNGALEDAIAIVRILDIVEIFLLPKIIAKLAVKRYPKWSQMSPFRKYVNRFLVYIGIFVF